MMRASIVGAAGLEPTLAAVRRGAIVALANKECLVSAGKIMMNEVDRNGATLLPVDSEHSAIFQALNGEKKEQIKKIILTASGGPFRTIFIIDWFSNSSFLHRISWQGEVRFFCTTIRNQPFTRKSL